MDFSKIVDKNASDYDDLVAIKLHELQNIQAVKIKQLESKLVEK